MSVSGISFYLVIEGMVERFIYWKAAQTPITLLHFTQP